jgi:uncharacterized membrane protein
LRRASTGLRALCAMIGGVLAGTIASFVTLPAAAILIGWDAASMIFLIWLWGSVWSMNSDVTAHLARREDPGRAVAEIAVVGAGTSMLVAVGFALLRAGRSSGGMKAYLIGLGVLSVALSWAVVHTVFTLQYARAYYSRPVGGIEFNETDRPTYLDFAYLSFTIGMTYQVSDTNITTKKVRRIILSHAFLSFLFGAVILGVAINVVASLLR